MKSRYLPSLHNIYFSMYILVTISGWTDCGETFSLTRDTALWLFIQNTIQMAGFAMSEICICVRVCVCVCVCVYKKNLSTE